ncbi:periplasmic heavy metal sensor [Shimia aestuarii]|uniref:Heavy-metal resistance n=1 Tax=Shimia aestuarii TaxID=254406 RepID=A0A1I4QYQ3_9RHOB|nr:periplasmic heavy metal sensor [Shimia aestuarii]SFM44846.1 Heavy-metal resistance [Shimia aestuarii]
MTQDTEKKPGMRRGLRLLLIGSLALNLLVVGVVGGAVISHQRGVFGGHPDRFGSPYVRAFSHEHRREMGKALRQAYRQADVDRHGDRQSFERVVALLRATPLDRHALREELVKQASGSAVRRDMAQGLWLEKVEAMSGAERAAYADRLEDSLKHGNRKKYDKRD